MIRKKRGGRRTRFFPKTRTSKEKNEGISINVKFNETLMK